MNGLLKLIGGVLLGAAAGAAVYLTLTSDDEEGIVHDMKALVDDVINDGKRSAAERRAELERELTGQTLPVGGGSGDFS